MIATFAAATTSTCFALDASECHLGLPIQVSQPPIVVQVFPMVVLACPMAVVEATRWAAAPAAPFLAKKLA